MKTKVYKKLVTSVALVGALVVGATSTSAHEVQKGDTLGNIAYNHNTTVNALAELNPSITNVNLIYVGETIRTNSIDEPYVAPVRTVAKVTPTTTADNSETDLLARIVEAESSGESYQGKVAVAEVILNRLNSNGFPNTIRGVIYQSGQFSPVRNGTVNNPASEESKQAVREALSSPSSIVGNSLFFYNPRTASSRWLDAKPTIKVIGNHTFK